MALEATLAAQPPTITRVAARLQTVPGVGPIDPSTVAALRRYEADRDRCRVAPRSESFFRTERLAALSRMAVQATFAKLRRRLGWTAEGRARLPRLQDMRHAFVVHRVQRWYEQGADVDRRMAHLATYLGHAKVTDTYWYLTAVPELMALTARPFRRTYDALRATHGERADVEYVRILHLAASTLEVTVGQALETLLATAAPFDYAAVKALAAPETPPVPPLDLPAPDLHLYDHLLTEVRA